MDSSVIAPGRDRLLTLTFPNIGGNPGRFKDDRGIRDVLNSRDVRAKATNPHALPGVPKPLGLFPTTDHPKPDEAKPLRRWLWPLAFHVPLFPGGNSRGLPTGCGVLLPTVGGRGDYFSVRRVWPP